MKTVSPIRDKKKLEDMKKILISTPYGERNLLIFSIGINTAYRISDLRQLKLSDVLEVSRGRIVVKDRLDMKEQKTSKQNSVFISNKLKKLILDFVQSEFPMEIANRDFDVFLFQSRNGQNQPLSRQSFWRVIHTAAETIHLKNIGPHSMRKTFGYFLYKQGTRIEIIQSLLNHSSQRETLRYIGITQEDKDVAVRSLEL
ncbi:tyrosine-type recombinase/integrase [Enterococcus sp. ALS3]|uniref:Tyrosine-type recombinase/integrase n=1 Tax=Enterococcus alishanensis TaxID=1303817 RepID=A0ABS6TF91_9ENTE|nr:tyrosine-type recombinase/integrase [Enterococcus alishanensis]MBV7391515.1 tyrosine-type recombinase/integrase [Enterococcus alishanensis]